MTMYNVLITEDDFRVAGIWKEFTETVKGFAVADIAKDGEEALNLLKKTPVDLLVMDVYMPDIDGLQLLSEIRKMGMPLDVIVITAAKESDIIQRILRLGIVDYIVKPCVLERFQLALNRFESLRNTFHKEELEQAELDALLHGYQQSEDESRDLPKGMQEITLKRVMRCFDNNPYSRSAEEIAKSTGLSLATVQRYLRYMSMNDLLKKELTYGSQGRPEHKYSKK